MATKDRTNKELTEAIVQDDEAYKAYKEDTGHCKHGSFPLLEGCRQCIAEMLAEQDATFKGSPEYLIACRKQREGEPTLVVNVR